MVGFSAYTQITQAMTRRKNEWGRRRFLRVYRGRLCQTGCQVGRVLASRDAYCRAAAKEELLLMAGS